MVKSAPLSGPEQRPLPGLVNINQKRRKIHPCSMGKSTVSTGPCSIVFCMFTRGYIHQYPSILPSLSHDHPYKTILNHSKPRKTHHFGWVNPLFSWRSLKCTCQVMPWYNELTKSEGSGVRPGTSGTGDPNLRDGGLSFIYSIDIVIDIVI